MLPLAPGRYYVSHGMFPLPTPSKPGQEIVIANGNPFSFPPVAWNLKEVDSIPEFSLLKCYILETDDKSGYLTLMNPSSQKGGLTTAPDFGGALTFVLLPTFAGTGHLLHMFKIHSAGGLVTTVSVAPGMPGAGWNVEVAAPAAGEEAGESQIWYFRPAPQPNA